MRNAADVGASVLRARELDRRSFLALSCGVLLWPLGGAARAETGVELPAATRRALETSPYAYISPLRSDGTESRCHGEVWFGWIDGSVVINTSPDRWKATAIAKGLDRAKIWVGDHGRWKTLTGTNEAFRAGPSFEAHAEVATDPGLIDVLLAQYDVKYPNEIASWRDKMKNGIADGTRVLLRYRSR